VSRQRAKKKQRRRARTGAAAPAAAATAPAERARRSEEGRAAPRHPSRLEVRDGIPRPGTIWAPFPLTELGMAVGIVVFLAGFATGGARGAWLLAIGVVMLAVVVAELCLREHFGGFRSHSLLLGLLAVTAVHTGVVLLVTSAWHGPLVLVVDLAVAGGVAWWLQGRFRAAQERARRRGALSAR
jgi:Flp pilus assembly protein TadB